MKIELKNVTYNARLSHETAAFAATVYIDGQRRGEVENGGQGGPDIFRPYELGVELDVYAKTLPERPFGHGMKGTFQPDADTVIAGLLDDFLLRRDLTRDLNKKVIFVQGGKIWSIKKPGAAPAGAEVVLNALPFDEAVETYRRMTEIGT